MEFELLNNQSLRSFVFRHKLMDNRSIIQFYALVTIRTQENKVTNEQMTIMITLDGDMYGEVYLLENDLDPYIFPTLYKARYQNMDGAR